MPDDASVLPVTLDFYANFHLYFKVPYVGVPPAGLSLQEPYFEIDWDER